MPERIESLAVLDLHACPLCRSERMRPAGFAYLFAGRRFPGRQCADCGFVFLSRQPTREGLARLYDAEYFDRDYHCGHEETCYFENEEPQVDSAASLISLVERHRRPGVILEVGCAGGYFLQAAAARGWTPIGIEVSGDAARFARETLGLTVHAGTLEEIRLDEESIDAVYMGDVLEHMTEPRATLRRLRRLLRPGGVLLIAGPITINSLDRRLGMWIYRSMGRTKILKQPPYHLLEFTPRTLGDALRRAGFDVLYSRQSKIPPRLGNPRRRPLAEHLVKLCSDAINYMLTRASGHLGDRMLVLAMRPRSGAKPKAGRLASQSCQTDEG